MNYWIFKANPDLYDVEEHIHGGNPPSAWKVSRYRQEMKAGDTGFVWRTGQNVVAVESARINVLLQGKLRFEFMQSNLF
jgi:hypothetical protein